jgi:putative redox protein
MKKMVTAQWQKNMAFDLTIEDATIPVDADEKFGGEGYGPKPKGLMLTSLAGCTGMDVVSMLGKMRIPFDGFSIEIEAENAEEHPKVFTNILVRYIFTGDNLNEDKIETAIELSLGKYCAVAATLKHTATIIHELVMNP